MTRRDIMLYQLWQLGGAPRAITLFFSNKTPASCETDRGETHWA
jgi:hypothetical protein